MKKIILLCGMLLASVAVTQATLYSYTYTSGFANGGAIPDGNPTGWSDNRSVALATDFGPLPGGTTTEIVDVNVRLNLSGTYNGDLYGYLVHSSGFAVLLNRSGRTSTDGFGYGDDGFDITLDGQDTSHTVNDIHRYGEGGNNPAYSSGKLIGTWQEDGRNVNPATVTDGDSRTALLTSFNTLSADGTWTLFLADMSGGDVSTLVNWGLDISVVPEPTTWALIIFGVVLGGVKFRQYWRKRRVA